MEIIDKQKIVTIKFTLTELIDIANDIYRVEKSNTNNLNIDSLLKLKDTINTID